TATGAFCAMPRRIATAPATTRSAWPLIKSAIMIGPLLDRVTGRTSRFSSLKNPAPRATAVGSPVFQLGDTRATVTGRGSAAPANAHVTANSAKTRIAAKFFTAGELRAAYLAAGSREK